MGVVTGLEQMVRHLHVLGARVIEEALLGIKFGQLDARIDGAGIQIGELLVDGNGFYCEAVLRILVADFLEIYASLVVLTQTGMEVANRVEDSQVLGVLFDHLFVLGNGIGKLALLDMLLSRAEDLCLVETKPKCHIESLKRLNCPMGNGNAGQFSLKYHTKMGYPKLPALHISACPVFTLMVRISDTHANLEDHLLSSYLYCARFLNSLTSSSKKFSLSCGRASCRIPSRVAII